MISPFDRLRQHFHPLVPDLRQKLTRLVPRTQDVDLVLVHLIT